MKAREILIIIAVLIGVVGVIYAVFYPDATASLNQLGVSTREVIYAEIRRAGVEDVHKCLQWAFGEDVDTIRIMEFDDRWRQRHPELFTVHGADDLFVTINKIAIAYKYRELPR